MKKWTGQNLTLQFQSTPHEDSLCRQHNLTLEQLRHIRNLSKGQFLTLEVAISRYQDGTLTETKPESPVIKEVEKVLEDCPEVTKGDDVDRLLRRYMEVGDAVGLRIMMTKVGCNPEKVDNLVTAWELETANVGIIKMRAGNMLRAALRKLI